MRCPRDGSTLKSLTLDDITTDGCPRCGGLWLDASELSRVTNDAELERLAHAATSPSAAAALQCPRCAATLHEGRIESVAVDPCPSCKGVWLDAGELRDAERQVLVRRWNERRGKPAGLVAFASATLAPAASTAAPAPTPSSSAPMGGKS